MTIAANRTAPVAAVIVSYNSARTLPPLLRSLAASTVDVEAIVVDNGSADESVAVARSFDGVRVVETHANLGYSGGINAARELVAPHQAIAVLNPDLTVAPDALERLLAVLDDPAVGVVGPTILNSDGSRFPSLFREPRLLGSLGEALLGDRLARRPAATMTVVRADAAYRRPGDAEWVSGAALVVSARCNAAVGAWDDETFFLYWEETDYQRRAREAGFRIGFEPSAVVVHEKRASGASAALDALQAVNRVRYADKHHGRAWAEAMRTITWLQYAARVGLRPELRLAAELLRDRGRWGELPRGDRPVETTTPAGHA